MPSSQPSPLFPHKQQGSTTFGFIIGLFSGLILAVVVAFFASDVRFSASDKLNPAPGANSLGSASPDTASNPNVTLVPQKDAAVESDFSTVREHVADEMGFVITDEMVRAPNLAQPEAKTPPVQVAPSAQTAQEKPDLQAAVAVPGYYVQAGAFRSQTDAQTQRAKLAFLGKKGFISQYNNGAEVIYRVRLGPYPTRTLADASRNNLQKAGLDAATIKQ